MGSLRLLPRSGHFQAQKFWKIYLQNGDDCSPRIGDRSARQFFAEFFKHFRYGQIAIGRPQGSIRKGCTVRIQFRELRLKILCHSGGDSTAVGDIQSALFAGRPLFLLGSTCICGRWASVSDWFGLGFRRPQTEPASIADYRRRAISSLKVQGHRVQDRRGLKRPDGPSRLLLWVLRGSIPSLWRRLWDGDPTDCSRAGAQLEQGFSGGTTCVNAC